MTFQKWGGGGQRPFGNFPKFHPFWCGHPSLRKVQTWGRVWYYLKDVFTWKTCHTYCKSIIYTAVSLYLLQYISDEVMNEKFASSWGIPHLSQASYSWSRSTITNDPRKTKKHFRGRRLYGLKVTLGWIQSVLSWSWASEHSYLSSTSKNSICTTSSDKERYFEKRRKRERTKKT